MARRQKTAAESADQPDKAKESAKSDQSGPNAKPETAKTEQSGPTAKAEQSGPTAKTEQSDPTPKAEGASKPAERAAEAKTAPTDPQELPAIEPPAPRTEPWPDATPQPMKPVQPAARAQTAEPAVSRAATVAMPVAADPGKPPEMPHSVAPPPLALGSVEDPTHMPGPKDVPSGSPEDPAPAPGHVPPGDSRSLRRGKDFALIYRVGTCVISRTGVVGTRGQWRVVEYPTSASASNSYAKECSRFVSEGFSDYRE